MSKPIIVGYDPATSDRAPVNFGVAAARFTGAPLIVASASAGRERPSRAGQQDEDLVVDASEALDEARRELEPEGIAVEGRELASTSAARALHEASEAEDAGLLVVGSTRRGPVGRVRPRFDGRAAAARRAVPDRDRAARLEGRRRAQHVGVAYVDTEEGREALRRARTRAAEPARRCACSPP